MAERGSSSSSFGAACGIPGKWDARGDWYGTFRLFGCFLDQYGSKSLSRLTRGRGRRRHAAAALLASSWLLFVTSGRSALAPDACLKTREACR
jgi:hypothetical protein